MRSNLQINKKIHVVGSLTITSNIYYMIVYTQYRVRGICYFLEVGHDDDYMDFHIFEDALLISLIDLSCCDLIKRSEAALKSSAKRIL